jgi:hypothetical protein
MIVTESGIDPKVSALVYVAARAPDAGEDYTALANEFPTPPASAGIVWSDDWGQLSEEAFLRDFAGDLPADKARVLYSVQAPFRLARSGIPHLVAHRAIHRYVPTRTTVLRAKAIASTAADLVVAVIAFAFFQGCSRAPSGLRPSSRRAGSVCPAAGHRRSA